MKKEMCLIIALMFTISFISAIDLKVDSTVVSDAIITDFAKPAIFDLEITNFGSEDDFEIYSLVGIDITPTDKINLKKGETKVVQIQVMPQKHLLSKNKGYFSFEYKIKDSKNDAIKDQLTINILGLSQAVSVISDNINPSSTTTKLTIKNNANYDFTDLNLRIVSAFFDVEQTLNLEGLASKSIDVELNREKVRTSESGDYLVNTKIKVEGEEGESDSILKFLEREGIETTKDEEGFLIKRTSIIKFNVGNVYQVVDVNVEKSIFAYLFTTFNIAPTETDFDGFTVKYYWKIDLVPGEKSNLIVKTNWLWPIIIIAFAVIIFISVKRYIESDLIFTKNVSFVKTTGGEFALKVHLRVRAKEYVENVQIVDKLPYVVNLYDKFGAITPDKVDLKNRRVEWNVDSLNKGEERIFSYIIYSKIGVVGRFELPAGKAIYEKDGKIKETQSNRSFYINEPKQKQVKKI